MGEREKEGGGERELEGGGGVGQFTRNTTQVGEVGHLEIETGIDRNSPFHLI